MKAVILAGSPGTARFPFANYYPKLGFPVANEPLINHMAHHLQVAGITEIAISVSDHYNLFRAMARRINRQEKLGVRVRIVKEDTPMGTAGTLRNMTSFIQDSSVLVISSSAFITGHDLSEVIHFHEEQGASLTAVVERCGPSPENLDNFKLDADGRIKEYIVIHESRNRRNPARCLPGDRKERREHMCNAGIYVVGPKALEVIRAGSGYMDINEQLIPALDKAGILAKALPVPGPLPKIIGLRQYFEANRRTLMEPGEDQDFVFRKSHEIADGVWVGEGVVIADSARVQGPVLIGDHCRIGEDVEITGPVCIGPSSTIDRGAKISSSILGPATWVGKSAHVEESMVAERAYVRKNEHLATSIVVKAKELDGGLFLIPDSDDDGFKVILRYGRFVPRLSTRRKIYYGIKRMIDLSVAGTSLLVLAPLFGLIAIAIKRDGGGSVIYAQSRCGKNGRNFKMYKFRTMVENAHELQVLYQDEKDVDGPMFKLENDPRVTRVGRFLRDTSLDELPQLVNVLKSEMSLVGPRPLIMDEMDFAPSWRDIRLKAKPGITGLWQVNGRDKVSFHDWIQNDIRYVKEQSLGLDFKIILRTLRVLRGGKSL